MPEQTYNIGYNSNDFFYKTGTENTLPFNIPNLITWTNSYISDGNNKVPSTTTNIFDERITNVVLNNKDNFKNKYLPGNIIIGTDSTFSNFNSITISDQEAAAIEANKNKAYTDFTKSIKIGSITLNTTTSAEPIKYELNDQSTIEYKTNSFGMLDDKIEVNADITGKAEMEIAEADDDPSGGPSYLSPTTLNPRCKYKPKCTISHWHYTSCEKQIIKGPNGSYCKCVCKGPKINNAEPHSHCSPYNISVDGKPKEGEPPDSNFRNLLSGLKNVVVSMTKESDAESSSSAVKFSGSNITYNYGDSTSAEFMMRDETIRQSIYDYYEKLNENKLLSNKIISNDSQNNTNNQALLDANVKYKKEYLHLFNIFSGICFVSGYIYVMYKSKS
jgi:hypothetical protein